MVSRDDRRGLGWLAAAASLALAFVPLYVVLAGLDIITAVLGIFPALIATLPLAVSLLQGRTARSTALVCAGALAGFALLAFLFAVFVPHVVSTVFLAVGAQRARGRTSPEARSL